METIKNLWKVIKATAALSILFALAIAALVSAAGFLFWVDRTFGTEAFISVLIVGCIFAIVFVASNGGKEL